MDTSLAATLFAVQKTLGTGTPCHACRAAPRRGRLSTASALLGVAIVGLPLATQAQSTTTQKNQPTISLSAVNVTAAPQHATQSTPSSVTQVSGDALHDRGISNVTTLAQSAPGVSLKSEGPGQTEIELRGMSATGGNSPTTGFYLDGIPLTAPAGAQNGKVVIDPTLYDLDRVEILRGPQGSEGGAGSMGGAVLLVSNPPDPNAFAGSIQSTLSGTDGGGLNHAVNAMLNLPLVADTLALRVVATQAHTSGWIDRIVADPFPLVSTNGAVRGDVVQAPVRKRYRGSNAQRLDGVRVSVLWKPSARLSFTPSFFLEDSHQNGISAYDSVPGTDAHYQPFDIAEPLTDRIAIFSLAGAYHADDFDLTSTTAYWHRRSTQTEDASENFNNPDTGVTWAANNDLPNPGYYGPGGSGEVYGHENDPSGQFSQEFRIASTGDGPLQASGGLFFSNFSSTWTFDGTTPNPSAYMDIGTFAPATTPNWFDAFSPTRLKQSALFGNLRYAITDQLKAELGVRLNHYGYRFSSIISGWGSALGAATPSASGRITQSGNSVDPKLTLSWQADPDLLLYTSVARGSRPGGGNARYPTTGPYWSAVFTPYNFADGKWPSSYRPDAVWSYEFGEKAKFLDHHLSVDTSVYYEDWRRIQLEALPGDWALNINGNHAEIYGGEIAAHAFFGHGFELSASGSYTHDWVDPGPHWQLLPAHVLPDVTPVVGNLVFSYSRELSDVYSLRLQAENAYVGKRYSLAFPYGYTLNGKYIHLPAYDLTNLRATLLSSANWDATLFVDNAFNKRAELESLFQEDLPSASFNRIVSNQPRTIGLDFEYRY